MAMSTVSIPVIVDNIAEGPEHFNLTLIIPSSLSPAIIAGSRNRATGVITDSTSKCVLNFCITNNIQFTAVLVVEFTSGQFFGSESSGFIEVIVRITGGSSNTPITVTVTPSVQSPVSAMGRQ